MDVLMMARQVGPRGSKPELSPVLRGRAKDEVFPGEFHQGQQADPVCTTGRI